MKAKSSDPRRLDVVAAARNGLTLEGAWSQSEFARLADVRHDVQAEAPPVAYEVQCEARSRPGGQAEPWLHLGVTTTLTMTCQRCLGALEVPLEIDRWLHFVADEDTAAALDGDSEVDVLPLPRALDVRELAEDELLLALPIVPRHDVCPEPPKLVFDADEALLAPEEIEEPAPHPFAALAALKKPPSGTRN